ncbi:thiolase [Frankia sp. AiPs1]|uniref:thiolase C-terminal domain-containing protein n=1 Tax=Frankia sp. AiPs1 TaxID=573493 RepID=UPI00204420EB|nr:thiolase [Frankia sp. AiPs1]MCM3921585.1 thiolase [Frankia sp. AiPs1]
MKDQTAIAGIGYTPYYKRGQSLPQTETEMACKAILAALADAGLTVHDLDGFTIYSSSIDPATVGSILGVPEVRFAATLTSGGGGTAGSLGLAAAAIVSGQAEVCVTVMTLQQAARRLGGTQVDGGGSGGGGGGGSPYGSGRVPQGFVMAAGSGLLSPGHSFALLTQRHMKLYGTKREHLAEVAISQRENAIKRPTALRREPLTLDDYFNARMLSDPLCLFDYTMESDGAVAAIVTSAQRARDLRQPPVYIMGSANGGAGRWGSAIFSYFQMPDEYFASSGHRTVAKRMFDMAGVGPQDVDVALLYDHFSPLVIMQLEDYGFCGIGEGGPFVAEGNIRFDGGTIAVNTHGGHLSEAYIIGMTHVREAVEQLRGVAVNQVQGAEIALVTGGPAGLPVSGTLLRR